VVEGDVHKSQKQILRGSFGTGPIKDLYPIFWDKSIALLNTLGSKLKTSDNRKRVSFGRWCERVTLDIIGCVRRIAGRTSHWQFRADNFKGRGIRRRIRQSEQRRKHRSCRRIC
jgi:hypothetical protein